ncbi:hypothetical protein FQA39_LY14580 [Lamprigera yunnana]|nr:hypothetical protein FQA39_LY14580 [Lamprigera yunnana]
MYKFIIPVLVFFCVQVFLYDIPLDVIGKDELECLKNEKLSLDDIINYLDEKFYLPEDNTDVNTFFEKSVKCKFYVQDGKVIKHLLERLIKTSYLRILKREDIEESVPNIAEKCIHINNENLAVRLVKVHNCVVHAIHDL